MRAGILAVGSELLGTDRLDTNSLRLTAILERYGIELIGKAVVGDDEPRIAAEVSRLLTGCDLVVVGGGLGPTADDVTREACARALGRELIEDAGAWAAIERRFAAVGRTPSPNNRRQAFRIDGAALLDNPRGSAPGQRIDLDGRSLFLFPGVPTELDGMIERELVPWLERNGARVAIERRTLHVAMRPESEVDARLEKVYESHSREAITVLAAPGEVRIRCVAAGGDADRRAKLDALETAVREALGDAVYGVGDQISLESVVGDLLVRRGLSIATAESCTGGLVAERLTRIPGSSRYFPGGVVTYSNEQKRELLGVTDELLERRGAVSEEVARAMADGVRRRLGSDLGVAVTGIAGPAGGSDEKPVGTVHLALSGSRKGGLHRRIRLPGDRRRIRWQASQAALELVRRGLLGLGRR